MIVRVSKYGGSQIETLEASQAACCDSPSRAALSLSPSNVNSNTKRKPHVVANPKSWNIGQQ